jgi:hypothetical protein
MLAPSTILVVATKNMISQIIINPKSSQIMAMRRIRITPKCTTPSLSHLINMQHVRQTWKSSS